MDNPIIKNPFNGEPYIPGSSIKGKMRALMELVEGNAGSTGGEPCNCGNCNICKVFGCGVSSSNTNERSPTRLMEKIFSSLSQQEKEDFLSFIDKSYIKEIAKKLHNYVNDNNILYKVPVTKSFENKFNKKLEDPENQLIVYETYRSLNDYFPVIPGSSIKGAIRTAILSAYGEEIDNKNLYYYDHRRRETLLKNDFENIKLNFSNAKNDPFRAIRITDFRIEGKNSQRVGDVVNYKPNRKRGNDISQMQNIKEYIIGSCLDGDAKGEFELTIDDFLQEININGFRIDLRFNIEDIFEKCDKFYKNHLTEESKKFYKESIFQNIKNMRDKLLEEAEKIDTSQKECLIRVGKHSHVENVTIDKHRAPETKRNIWGTSRFLIEEEYFPLGFAKLKFEEIK